MLRFIPGRNAALIVLVAFACAPKFARAQETVNFASISGRVIDPSGAAIGSAEVSARQVDTGQITQASTEADGRFRFPYLRLGSYEIKVHKDGFADHVSSLTLTVGSAFELPVVMQVASVQSAVTVTSEAGVLESARSQIAGTVSTAEIQNLPLNGRNFLDVALLVPGVSPTNTAANQLFRGNLGRAWAGNLDRQPAEFLQQLHCGWPFQQRRRGRA